MYTAQRCYCVSVREIAVCCAWWIICWVIFLTAKKSSCGRLAGSVLVVSGVLRGSGWLANSFVWSLRSGQESSHSSCCLAARLFRWAYFLFWRLSEKALRQTMGMAGVRFTTARVKSPVFISLKPHEGSEWKRNPTLDFEAYHVSGRSGTVTSQWPRERVAGCQQTNKLYSEFEVKRRKIHITVFSVLPISLSLSLSLSKPCLIQRVLFYSPARLFGSTVINYFHYTPRVQIWFGKSCVYMSGW